MTKTKQISYIIMAVAIVLCAISFAFVVWNNDLVFADNQLEQVYNLNQLYRGITQSVSASGITFTNSLDEIGLVGTSTGDGSIYFDFSHIDINHKIYFRLNNYDKINRVNMNSGNGIISSNYDLIYTNKRNGNGQFFVSYDVGTTFNNKYKPILIDLTLMFGEEKANNLTIEQCREIFVAPYYSYNSGTSITSTYLDGYKDGSFAMQDGFTISDVASDFVNTAYLIEANSNNSFNKLDNMISFDGIIGINTTYTLIANDYIILGLTTMGDSEFDICQSGSNGEVLLLQHISSSSLPNTTTTPSGYIYHSGTITIKLKNDANTILFRGTSIMTCNSIKYKTFNYTQAIYDSYLNGYNSVDRDGIYQNGYDIGFQEGITRNANNVFSNGWDFVKNTMSSIGDLFTLEFIPNVPLWTFLAIPMLFVVLGLMFKLTGNN